MYAKQSHLYAYAFGTVVKAEDRDSQHKSVTVLTPISKGRRVCTYSIVLAAVFQEVEGVCMMCRICS